MAISRARKSGSIIFAWTCRTRIAALSKPIRRRRRKLFATAMSRRSIFSAACRNDFILREIWGSDANARYLRIYIRALRQKIEVDPERPTHILTVTRVGYRLRESD